MSEADRLLAYAGLAVEELDLNVMRAHDMAVAEEVGGRFKALADAEIARVRHQNEGWCYSCGDLAQGDDVAPIVYRLRAELAEAEASLARVKGLADAADWKPLGGVVVVKVDDLRATLAGES